MGYDGLARNACMGSRLFGYLIICPMDSMFTCIFHENECVLFCHFPLNHVMQF
jgi:hypothetical protein